MRCYFSLILITCFIIGCAVQAKKRDYFTNLDYTTVTSHQIAAFSGEEIRKTPLRTLPSDRAKQYVFGIYRRPFYPTTGHDLYLFPNGSFAITEFSCLMEEKTLAVGSWELRNDRIILSADQRRPGLFKDQWLEHDALYFFVISDPSDEFIGESLLLTEKQLKGLHLEEYPLDYLTRWMEYEDWGKKLERLRKQISEP